MRRYGFGAVCAGTVCLCACATPKDNLDPVDASVAQDAALADREPDVRDGATADVREDDLGRDATLPLDGSSDTGEPHDAAADAMDAAMPDAGPVPAIVVTTGGGDLETTESRGRATITVVLATEPTTDVTIEIRSSDEAEGTASPRALTFTAATWNVPRTVTVVGEDDALDDGDVPYAIVIAPATTSEPGEYTDLDADDPSVINRDDDTAQVAVTLTTAAATTETGGTARFTLVLGSEPSSDVRIPLVSSDASEGGVAPDVIVFTPENWHVPVTATVTGAEDFVDDGAQPYTVLVGPIEATDTTGYATLDPTDVALTNADDDASGIVVSPTTGLLTTEAGGQATFTIALRSQPTGDVMIPLRSTRTSEATTMPTSVLLTTLDWAMPHVVTVTGANDTAADGSQTFSIVTDPATTVDTSYSGVNAPDVGGSNRDDDGPETAGITVTPRSGLVTTESGGAATFQVVLDAAPTANVTVGFRSSLASEGTVMPSSIVFTPADWNLPRTVTVRGTDDAVDDGDVTFSAVTDPATSTDTAYAGINPGDVSVRNTDDDQSGITVTTTSSPVTTERGTTATFRVALTSQPTGLVTVALTSSDTTEGTVSPPDVSFDSAAYFPRIVTVTGQDDMMVDGNVDFTITTSAATGSDTRYVGLDPPDVALTNADDEILVERVNVATDGTQAAGGSFTYAIPGSDLSDDARFVAFASSAGNLVADDTNGTYDVFVRDRTARTTTRISVSSDGTEGDGASGEARMTPDGAFVVFESAATNLVPDDTGGRIDVFLRDLAGTTIERIAPGNGDARRPAVSADGRYVAFESAASDLVADDANGLVDVFVHDRVMSVTERVSVSSAGDESNGDSTGATISADGRFVMFSALASNLVPGDRNGASDVLVHDRMTDTTFRVSVAPGGAEADGASVGSSLSRDGRYVGFESSATTLVASDTNGVVDVFVRDVAMGTTERVSLSDGEGEPTESSFFSVVASNPQIVLFSSRAPSLVVGDTNGLTDVFVRDRAGGSTRLVSLGDLDQQGTADSTGGSVASDGRTFLFWSRADNLVPGDTNGVGDLFVRRAP